MPGFVLKYFGDRKFWSIVLKLALPIAFQNFLMSSFSLVDTLMIGQLGDLSLSAVGMANQWSWLMGLVMFGLNSGGAVFFSQYWGIGDIKQIHKIYGVLLINLLAVSVFFSAVGLFAPEFVVGLFNKDAQVIEVGASYLRIACISYLAQAFNYAFSSVLRSTENVRLPMFSGLVSAVMNVIFNYIFIFGAFGIPGMGVRGAAIATVISAWSAPLFIFIVSLIKKTIVIAPLAEIFSFERKLLARFYLIASPVIVNESMWGLGSFCYNIVFGNLGYEHYAAVTIYRTIDSIMFVFFIGLCNASCVMIGKSIGAGNLKKGQEDAARFVFIVPLLALLVGITVALFRENFIWLFNSSGNITQTTIDSADGILIVAGLEYAIRMIPYILVVGIFRSGGDTLTGMKYDLIFLWGFALPLTVIAAFVLELPFTAVFAVMLFGEDTIKSVLCIKRFLSKKWIKPITDVGRRAVE